MSVVLGRESIQQFIDRSQDPVVILYADMIPRLMTFVPIAVEVGKRNCQPILLINHGMDDSHEIDDIESQCAIGVVSASELQHLSGASLYFAPDTCRATPPRGVVSIGIVHSLPDYPGLKLNLAGLLRNTATVVRNFDYLVTPSESSQMEGLDRLCDGIFPEQLICERSNCLWVVPGGYPKVDVLHDCFRDSEAMQDCILYCPTNSKQVGSHVIGHGKAIISLLLESYKDEYIVFRPYHSDGDELSILDDFEGEGRVVLDRSLTGIEWQKRARLLVTDRSSMAVSHALGSKRPVIFFEPDRAGGEVNDRGVLWDCVGFRVNTYASLKDAMVRCDLEKDSLSESIAQFEEEYLFNARGCSEYIADCIPWFLDKSGRDDFFKIQRQSFESRARFGDVDQHIKYLKDLWPRGTPFQRDALQEIEGFLRS